MASNEDLYLSDLLIAWIRTPDWAASEAYLREHAADLLTEAAESVLDRLAVLNPNSREILPHQRLLRAARAESIEAAYAQIPTYDETDERLLREFVAITNDEEMARIVAGASDHVLDAIERVANQRIAAATDDVAEAIRERLARLRLMRTEKKRVAPLQEGLLAFFRAETDDEARSLLLTRPQWLLSDEVEGMLALVSSDDPEAQAIIKTRTALWHQVRAEQPSGGDTST